MRRASSIIRAIVRTPRCGVMVSFIIGLIMTLGYRLPDLRGTVFAQLAREIHTGFLCGQMLQGVGMLLHHMRRIMRMIMSMRKFFMIMIMAMLPNHHVGMGVVMMSIIVAVWMTMVLFAMSMYISGFDFITNHWQLLSWFGECRSYSLTFVICALGHLLSLILHIYKSVITSSNEQFLYI